MTCTHFSRVTILCFDLIWLNRQPFNSILCYFQLSFIKPFNMSTFFPLSLPLSVWTFITWKRTLPSSQGRGLSSPSSPGWITVTSSSRRLRRSLNADSLCFDVSYYSQNKRFLHLKAAEGWSTFCFSLLSSSQQLQWWRKQWENDSLCLLWNRSSCRRKPLLWIINQSSFISILVSVLCVVTAAR